MSLGLVFRVVLDCVTLLISKQIEHLQAPFSSPPLMDLQQRWLNTTIDVLKIPGDLPQKWWGVIEGRYSETQRHYHTLWHLEEMFQHFDRHFKNLTQPELVVLAIFFHDIIYDPRAADNEEKSAEVFSQFSREAGTMEAEKTDKVRQWILITKSHNVQEDSEKDLQFFLDMDMAVLGRPSEDYKIYAHQIREEYKHVPEPEYKRRRSAVLRGFCERQRIFATDEFHELYHDVAIQNMKNEISFLEG